MQEKSSAATYTDAQRQDEIENCTEGMEAIKAGEYEKAREYFEVLASNGNLTATLDLARLHLRNLVVSPDPDYAITLLAGASASGMPDASDDLGQIYEAGAWRAQNFTRAFEFYRLSADQGSVSGAFNLGRCFLEGIGTPQHTANAMIWLGTAAHNDHSLACYWMGSLYSGGEYIDRDASMASNFYERGAALGHSYSQNKLGIMYRDGIGRDEDGEQAFSLFYLSAQSGNEWGQYLLGDMYKTGTHVEQNLEAAARFLTLSAEQGLVEAQVELGSMYGKGQGVPADRNKSIELYEAAAQQNSAVANFNLGIIYLNGDGVAQAIDTGAAYMRQAAHLGMQEAVDILEDLKTNYGIETKDIH